MKSSDGRDRDNADCVLLVDQKMAVFITAYNHSTITCEAGDDWETCSYKEQEIESRAGLHSRAIKKLFNVAKHSGIIYPDGYVNESALKYVQLLVKKKVREAS